MPLVDAQKCNGCGQCLAVCKCGALYLVNDRITVRETKDCLWCTECEAVCLLGAISCPFEIVIEIGRSADIQ